MTNWQGPLSLRKVKKCSFLSVYKVKILGGIEPCSILEHLLRKFLKYKFKSPGSFGIFIF